VKRARSLLLLVLGCAATGCGYSAGLRVRASGIDSIGVEFFGNDTFERDLERDFQGELTRALRDLSDVPLERADAARTVVRGTIREFHRRSGIRSPENQLLETGIYFEVEASLHAHGATEALRGPVHASTWVGFVIEPTGENERQARERAMRHVAEEVVLDLLAPVH
jgi:hypothetical protein